MDKDDKPDHWEEVLAGKRLPAPDKPDEHTAEQARQLLLWRQAQRDAGQQNISPQQAQAYYSYIHTLERQRRPWWRRHAVFWLGGGLLLTGALLGYGLTRWQLPVKMDDINSTSTAATKIATSPAVQHESSAPPMAAPTSAESLPAPSMGQPPSLYPEMINLPAGHFTMGCTPGWDDALGGCRSNEYPAHDVEVTAFRLSRHEVTVGQFRQFVEATGYQTVAEQNGCTIADNKQQGQWIISKEHHWRLPGFEQTDAHPVVCISWQDTQRYIQWLNETQGGHYRLATEQEWEYAARGGRVTAFFWGNQADRHFANYAGQESTDQWTYTAPAGQFAANPFGLHDMAGNVWEWVESCWQENYQAASSKEEGKNVCVSRSDTLRVRRGGGWDNQPPSIRSAYRSYGSEAERSNVYGFRVAQDIE